MFYFVLYVIESNPFIQVKQRDSSRALVLIVFDTVI